MTNITPGVQMYGTDMPPAAFDLDWTVLSNLSNTNYVFGSPEVGVNFTAPLSGRVLIAVGCGARNNTAANADRFSFTYALYEDNEKGLVIKASDLLSGVLTNGTLVASDFRYMGSFAVEENLQPGRNYMARTTYRTIAGSGTIDVASRNIAVIPLT